MVQMTDLSNLPIKTKQLAFVIWLHKIGYKGVIRPCGTFEFQCHVVNKRFPRNVKIVPNWGFNKPAKQLYAEFLEHLGAPE